MIHLFLYKTLWDLNNSNSSVGSTSSLHSDMNKNDMQLIHWIWTWHISRNTSHTQDLNLAYPKEPQSQETWGKALEKWKQWRNQATAMNWRRVHVLLFLFQWSMMNKIWSFIFLNSQSQRKLATTKPPYSKQTNKNQEVWIWITLLFPEPKVKLHKVNTVLGILYHLLSIFCL